MSNGKQEIDRKDGDNEASAADKLLGLGNSAFGMAAKFGLAGVVAYLLVHLVLFTIPKTQDKFHEELKSERELLREQSQKSRDHGDKVSKELTEAIHQQTRLMDFSAAIHQANQETMIGLQKKTIAQGAK